MACVMVLLRLPPRIKVLEALGAVADGRVRVVDEKNAEVVSSEGDRVYKVFVDLSRGVVSSSDNGTVYRGYIGYPIISFLMIKGVIPYDKKFSEALKGVRWRELNERYKKYSLVEQIVFAEAEKRGVSRRELESYVEQVMSILRRMRLFRES
ncbi:MAG: hypothetical protein ABWJ42_05945 [Sulfolobales archaeon]